MTRQTLTATYAKRPPPEQRSSLLLEQKEYKPLTGQVSKAALVNFIGRMFFGSGSGSGDDQWGESVDCGIEDGNINTEIYAYPSPATLPYRIIATHGELQPGAVQEIAQHEVFDLRLADEVSTRYPATAVLAAAPLGDLYDEHGSIVAVPAISVDGDRIRLARRVYGSLQVVYQTVRHAYRLVVPPRSLAVASENFFSSVIIAWFDGGGTWLEMETPPGADQLAAGGVPCGWGGGTSAGDDGDDGDDGKPKAAGADRSIYIDYCENRVISDNTYGNTQY